MPTYKQTTRLRTLLASTPAGSALPAETLAELLDALGLPADHAAQAVVVPTAFGRPGVRLLDGYGEPAGPDFCLLGQGRLPVYGVPGSHQRRHLGGFGDRRERQRLGPAGRGPGRRAGVRLTAVAARG